ncbi:MAG: hypothetical protein LBG76_00990 [Treponema sp.]|jgi:hypothetical protein|nr:hypothetical protein [Treponema sp.]
MKTIAFIGFFAAALLSAFAEEIPNTVGAVKAAKPGDYIVLQDGSPYVLTGAEIAIVNEEFDYNDGEALKENEAPRADGGTEFNITSAHKRIIWPDGKSMDILVTRRAFDDYMKFLVEQYKPIPYTRYEEVIGNSYPANVPDGLESFRGRVYKTYITNGVETFEIFEVKEFNRTMVGDGLERGFQLKENNLRFTLTGGGNFHESGARRNE